MNPIDDPARAARLARAVLSDVMTYNPEKVRLGIEHDDLFDRLAAEIQEAREYYSERVNAEVVTKTGAFDKALVDVLVFRSRHLPSKIW